MPIKEFWYGDTRLLKSYQIAHYREVSYTAWLQGQYNSVAFGVTLANAFSKSGSPTQSYPEWKDPMEKIAKPRKIKFEDNQEHNRQSEWFANMLQGK